MRQRSRNSCRVRTCLSKGDPKAAVAMKQFPPPPLPPLPPVEPEMVMVSEVPKNPRASVAVTVALPLSTPVTIPLLFTVKTEVLLLAQMYTGRYRPRP